MAHPSRHCSAMHLRMRREPKRPTLRPHAEALPQAASKHVPQVQISHIQIRNIQRVVDDEVAAWFHHITHQLGE